MIELMHVIEVSAIPVLVFAVLLALACYGFQLIRLFFKF